MEAEEGTSGPCFPPAPTTRPMRSNLGHRLQTGMNLQVGGEIDWRRRLPTDHHLLTAGSPLLTLVASGRGDITG